MQGKNPDLLTCDMAYHKRRQHLSLIYTALSRQNLCLASPSLRKITEMANILAKLKKKKKKVCLTSQGPSTGFLTNDKGDSVRQLL